MASRLADLGRRCHSVDIQVNPHRGNYDAVEAHLAGEFDPPDEEELPPAVRAEMIRTNTVVRIQCYPRTSVGFFFVYHHDIDAAVDQALIDLDQSGVPS